MCLSHSKTIVLSRKSSLKFESETLQLCVGFRCFYHLIHTHRESNYQCKKFEFNGHISLVCNSIGTDTCCVGTHV